jgi:hypothetical protein
MLIDYIKNFSSGLVVVPGHPEQGPFYLLKGLLKIIGEYNWESGNATKIKLFIHMLGLLSQLAQKKFIYHIHGSKKKKKKSNFSSFYFFFFTFFLFFIIFYYFYFKKLKAMMFCITEMQIIQVKFKQLLINF